MVMLNFFAIGIRLVSSRRARLVKIKVVMTGVHE